MLELLGMKPLRQNRPPDGRISRDRSERFAELWTQRSALQCFMGRRVARRVRAWIETVPGATACWRGGTAGVPGATARLSPRIARSVAIRVPGWHCLRQLVRLRFVWHCSFGGVSTAAISKTVARAESRRGEDRAWDRRLAGLSERLRWSEGAPRKFRVKTRP